MQAVAGLHVATVLKTGIDEAALVAAARKVGVQVHALGCYYARRPVKRGLLFGYGAIEEKEIPEGLSRLRGALRAIDTSL